MKILPINVPIHPTQFYDKKYFNHEQQAPLFPFGIACIASYLRDNGYEVDILDIFAGQLLNTEVLYKLRYIKSYDVIGISALVNQYRYVQWLAAEIKKIKDVPIILGNGLGTSCAQLVLRTIPEIDICVRGEGELTMKAILDNMGDLSSVSGITYRDKGNIVENPPRQPEKDIDQFKPAYDLFDMSMYTNTKVYDTGVIDMRGKFHNRKILPVLTSRGCPYACNFCGKVIPVARLRSVQSVIDEVKLLIDRYGITGVHFIDELFVVNQKRAVEFAQALKPLNIIWDCQSRANTIDYDTMRIMKDAGCVAIGIGIESGSQKILDNINKRITVKQIEYVMESAQKLKMPIKVQLIFGYPGETKDTIQETVGLFKRVHHPGRAMNPIVPIPGTTLWEYAKRKGLVEDSVEWLDKIKLAFDKKMAVVNFTQWTDKELNALRLHYDSLMVENYISYLLVRHPARLVCELIQFRRFRNVFVIKMLRVFHVYKLAKRIWYSIFCCNLYTNIFVI
jgi:radical SAM superfamily enzyme YgiQ (UPF0313 family)